MKKEDIAKYGQLSPFEQKDALIELASRDSDKMMLNAGRGNPNFLATVPRHGFWQLGLFATSEAERSFAYMPEGVGGHAEREGIEARFEIFVRTHKDVPGVGFLNAAVSYARDQLGLSAGDFLHEMVAGILGDHYPVPDRILVNTEKIIKQYLKQEMCGGKPVLGGVDLFATEGGTAAMTYIFDSLKQNKIISPGDTIALGRPIFTPYIEIPDLNNYQLEVVNLDADPANHWVFPDSELGKLLDPNIKAFFVANPSNPPSVRMSDEELAKIAEIVEKRPDLILLTDDVYGTFTDDFVSLFGVCPHNTILVYSYSKYFGACGWRLGVIALHEDNVIDRKIRDLPEADQKELDGRYASISLEPRSIKWIDRMVADSRTVALNHTAGASTPQQVMMVLFSLFCLMDEEDSYKNAMKRVVRRRHRALYKAMGIEGAEDPNSSYYYTVLDLEILGEKIYGRDFVDWALKNTEPSESLFRVAEEAQVVLLPAAGFGTVHRSSRVSLANLNESDYVRIGGCYRKVLDEYYETYKKQR